MKCKVVSGLNISIVLLGFVLGVLGIRVLDAQTEQSRRYEAHEHGVAHLNAAVEGADLHLEFTSPAANIVGFEHPPRTDAQKTTVKNAVDTLKDGEALIILPPGAQGRLAECTVHTDIDSEPGADSEDEHQHETGEEVETHAEADEHSGHSEFKAEYHFVCQHPEKLAHVDVMLLRAFPGIERIEVQLLTVTKQTAIQLTSNKNRIRF